MTKTTTDLHIHEDHFMSFRKKTIGSETEIETVVGKKPLIYADWIASGRLYEPIEDAIAKKMGPYVANTHTETSYTGAVFTHAYHEAKRIIKKGVGANEADVLIPCGTGMTGAVLKFQRILGLKLPEQLKERFTLREKDRPVVFITHMEHHSNQTSWLETIAHVELIKACPKGLVDIDHLEELLEKHRDRKLKIASVTGCSNVTGIETDYYSIAKRMHRAGGYCFVDFACSGPYVPINMHPTDPECRLDAVFLSPHKFLGGPGSPGVLIFNKELYQLKVPDQPGGGTVQWTNPWGEHRYYDDIEVREDGGTPGFLQTIKAAMAFQLKDKMNPAKIKEREDAFLAYLFDRLEKVPGLHILSGQNRKRIGSLSFYIEKIHYNLIVRLLSDLYGIQVRGGCSCAGTYGHFLLQVDQDHSKMITDLIDQGDLTLKPGWVRLSIHPTMTAKEIVYIADAIEEVAHKHKKMREDYIMPKGSNVFFSKSDRDNEKRVALQWFHDFENE